MIRLHAALREREAPGRLLLQVHDELILEADQGAAQTVAALAREVMEGVATLAVPLKAEVGIGPSWAAAKG
jgi:DNA polymerase-1